MFAACDLGKVKEEVDVDHVGVSHSEGSSDSGEGNPLSALKADKGLTFPESDDVTSPESEGPTE
jgi:hypothetical protein